MQHNPLSEISLIRKLKLNQLMIFERVLETRSVVRAANEMRLTQPAVTKVIHELESCFDGALFARSNRGVVPTELGLLLGRRVKSLMAELRSRSRVLASGELPLLGVVALDPALANLEPDPGNTRADAVAEQVARIDHATADNEYLTEEGERSPIRGALQLVFCDRGTPRMICGRATFSVAVSSGNSWPSWKMKPKCSRRRRERSASLIAATSRPSKNTSPWSGTSTPDMQCSSVDLPEPDGPMTATSSPGSMSREIPASTGPPPKSLVMSVRESICAMSLISPCRARGKNSPSVAL